MFLGRAFICLLVNILFVVNYVYAGRISGKILDEDGFPLPFASVLVKGTTMGTSSNAEGFYTLNLPEGQHVLIGQYIGYKRAEYK